MCNSVAWSDSVLFETSSATPDESKSNRGEADDISDTITVSINIVNRVSHWSTVAVGCSRFRKAAVHVVRYRVERARTFRGHHAFERGQLAERSQ